MGGGQGHPPNRFVDEFVTGRSGREGVVVAQLGKGFRDPIHEAAQEARRSQ